MTTYSINPVAKPRMTQRDKWKQRPTVMKYRAFKDHVALSGMIIPIKGAKIRFNVPMPKSWSKKKKAMYNRLPHMQRPDLDNYLKAVFDAVFVEDCTVWQVTAEKRWAYEGSIEVRNGDAKQTS